MIDRVAVEGYRSLRDVVVDLEALTVVTGKNGSGKSNFYRALRTLARVGQGEIVSTLAHDGGLAAVRWAGPERLSKAMRAGAPVQGTVRSGPIAVKLGYADADGLGYAIDVGLPPQAPGDQSRFTLDPHIKQEYVFAGLDPRPAGILVERRGPRARVKGADGWTAFGRPLDSWESVLDEFTGAESAPELLTVRRTVRSWRFHDAFRTDPLAPARAPQVLTRSGRLDDDGANLAAVLATAIESGADRTIAALVAEAFEGARLEFVGDDGRTVVALRQRGILRPLLASELSDGTLQYLLLIATLTSAERPSLVVLNEPERSVNQALIPALAALIGGAARDTQVLVVTHQAALVAALDGTTIELERDTGETVVAGREGPLDQPSWHWPKR